ncbi:MBL fold metallo-hydrolase [Marinococcus luteus]|uniref:MBL fold metallo-hydrolase n=1 Tax=Marinococcus luteus TaxID=1122204 RepID=UPI002ACD1222|nr:MBL fold metallo-hydrolase [Marinococcus luteus]MDZ5781904.1 MBL fold metallo-hydrolase [Marinococcus luteus]
MNIQQIRNATLIVEYAGKKFLVDPYLGEKGAYPPLPSPSPHAPDGDKNNPVVDLPVSLEEITAGIDAVIVTHTHPDHWDKTAKEALPKDIPLFTQNADEAETIRNEGFQHVEVLHEDTVFEEIQLSKTKGEHGRGEILDVVGPVCGVVFSHESEQTLYVAGDTVWYEGVQEAINLHQPHVIVVNAGDNQFAEGGSLVMGKEDVYELQQAAPGAKIVAVHMEAVNHWTLSKEELQRFTEEKGISSNILVPDDGEAYRF